MKSMSFGSWQEEGLETLEGTFYSFCHPILEIVMLHQKIFIFHFTLLLTNTQMRVTYICFTFRVYVYVKVKNLLLY